MEYVPPIGGAADAPYVNANPALGVDGSPVPAAAIEHTMREIVAVIEGAGLTPDGENLAQLLAAINALIAGAATAPAHDIPFLAGLDAEFAGQDLAVQSYGRVVVARDLVIEGEVAALDLAPTGAALILDVLVDGVSIYATRPQFAAGSTALTAGEFVGAAEEVAVDAGSVIEFAVDQIGSTIAGQGLAFTIQAREA